MIKLIFKPPADGAPDVLSRGKINNALDFLEHQLSVNGELDSTDFKDKRYWGEVKIDLWKYQDHKCCYCERQRVPNRESDVDHFRPKLAHNNEPAPNHKGYWWLAYDWENLFFVCSDCNSIYKKNSFPLINENEDNRAFTKDDDLLKEKPFLLNPATDDPEEFIIYDYTNPKAPLPVSSANDKEDRGKKTIEVLGLDKNTDLITGRSEKLVNMIICAKSINHMNMSDKDFGKELVDSISVLKSHISSKSQFAGFSRFFYKMFGLDQYLDNE